MEFGSLWDFNLRKFCFDSFGRYMVVLSAQALSGKGCLASKSWNGKSSSFAFFFSNRGCYQAWSQVWFLVSVLDPVLVVGILGASMLKFSGFKS